MGVFVFDHSLGDLAGEGIGDRNIDVVSGNREGLDQDGLDQQAGDHLAFGQRRLKVAVQGREEFLGKGHVCGHAKVVGTGSETLHVLDLHAGEAAQLFSLIRDQGANRYVVVVGFLLTFDHDRIDAAVGILVKLAAEVGELVGGRGPGHCRSGDGCHGFGSVGTVG